MKVDLRVTCPALNGDLEIPIAEAWLVRSPGQIHLSWRCPCQRIHDLAALPNGVHEVLLRAQRIRVVNLNTVAELLDAQRSPTAPRLTEDDASELVDALHLSDVDTLVEDLPADLVASVVERFSARAHRRRKASLAQLRRLG